jgi:hypothetical protein
MQQLMPFIKDPLKGDPITFAHTLKQKSSFGKGKRQLFSSRKFANTFYSTDDCTNTAQAIHGQLG